MENVRFGLEKMTISLTDEILEDYNIEIKLNDNKRKLLATLIYISGIDKNRDGYVFADNKWLMNVCGFGSEHTVINNVKYLSTVGLIETIRGRRSESSLYKICSEKCSIKVQPNEKSAVINSESAVIKCSNNVESAVINLKKCSNNSKSAVINLEKCSTDIEIDKDQDQNKTLYNTGKLDTTKYKEQIEELRSMVMALQDTVNKLTDSNKKLNETIENIRTCFKEDRRRLKTLEHITSTNQYNVPGIEDDNEGFKFNPVTVEGNDDNRDIDYRLFEDYSEGIESLSYCDEESEEYHSEDVSEHKEKENHITSIKLELDKANEIEMDKNKTYIPSTSAKAEEDITLQPTLKENNVEINLEPMKQQDSEQFTSTLTCESKEKKSCAKRKESSETFNNYNTQAEYFISINASEKTIDVLINDIEDDNRLNDEERDELFDILNNYKYKYAV